jgi:uncharacterized membrane protein YebE (DUF533 family)
LNDPTQLLSLFLDGVLGRSGRKRARRAARFVSGRKGFITASGLLAAAGVAWGIYDSLKSSGGASAAGAATPMPPPLPGGASPAAASAPATPPEVLRIVRLAVSAARADGTLSPAERALIVEHARRAGVADEAEREIERPHPLADIVRGVSEEAARHDLYKLAFAIVRADETVTGSERIYLAQLAHQLGLDAAVAARLEADTAAAIDSPDAAEPAMPPPAHQPEPGRPDTGTSG